MAFKVKPKTRSFNAGQWAYLMIGRTELEKHASACKMLRGMLIKPQGPMFRCPGTYYMGEAKHHDKKSRLEGFVFSNDQRYMLEFADVAVRFFGDDGIVLDGGSPYEVVSPYKEDDLFSIQFEQSNDVMFMTCPGYYPQKLSRYDHTNWTFEENTYDDGPFMDENEDDDVKLNVSDNTAGAENVDLIAVNKDIFEAGHVGALFKLSHVRPEAAYDDSYTSVVNSDPFEVFGKWEFVPHGTWTATVQIQRSYDGGSTWLAHRTITSKDDRNPIKTGDESEKNVKYRVAMTAYTSGTCDWDFTVEDKVVSGIAKITGITDARNAKCSIVSSPHSTDATERWCEGSWSDVRGYPRAIGMYAGRLWFGGTTHAPTGRWATKAGDYSKMEDGILDDDAIYAPLTEARQDPIYWMADQNVLFVGTKGSEHVTKKINDNEPLSGANIEGPRQSKYGSEPIQPIICSDVVLYIQKGGKKLLEMGYVYEKEGHDSSDLTILAEDITGPGVVQLAYQTDPDTRVWGIRKDGVLIAMTYNRSRDPRNNHDVYGWSWRDTDGEFESAGVMPGDTEDQLWLSVKRTINGQEKRYIEKMMPQEFGEQEDSFFVDSGLTFDGGADVAITDISVGADPYHITVTSPGHGRSDGQLVLLPSVGGMVEVSDKVFTVADSTDDTFVLKHEDGSIYMNGLAFGDYTEGGTVRRVAKVISGLEHLEGKEVQILTDGADHPEQVVTGGEITLDSAANKVHAGLGYLSVGAPMPYEIQTQAGTASKQKIVALQVHLYRSLGLKAGPDLDTLEEVNFRSIDDPMGLPPALFTGLKSIPFTGGYKTTGVIYLVQDRPLPMTVLSIEAEMGIQV